jgi:hypothetical protein
MKFLLRSLPEQLQGRILERFLEAKNEITLIELFQFIDGFRFMACPWFRISQLKEMVFQLTTEIFSPQNISFAVDHHFPYASRLIYYLSCVSQPKEVTDSLLFAMEKVAPHITKIEYTQIFNS